ncbi:leucine-rich repeat-containing protein 74A [Gastrophryne carolinensis]
MADLWQEMKSLSLAPRSAQSSAGHSDSDLELEELGRSPPAEPGSAAYLQACQRWGVVPVSYFLLHMNDRCLELNHHSLGPRGMGAIAESLRSNSSITHLSLEDNAIQAEGLAKLVEGLRENRHIRELNLSNNGLGDAGAELICRLLSGNGCLLHLRLACNRFGDQAARHFADAFSTNYRVTFLDLSHNDFEEQGGEFLGQMLAANEGLQELQLSWNHIRMKGAIALSAGLRVNGMLKVLDVSYNGFGNDGALALGEALRVNSSLLNLDIGCNHISNEGVRLLCRGLESNESLRVLKLSRNPLTVEGAIVLLNAITRRPENRTEELDISNVLVTPQFLHLLEEASISRPALRVLYAGERGFVAKKRPSRPNPMKVIQDFLDERKLRLLDFFKNMDKDGNKCVPVSDFCRYIALAGLPLDAEQIDMLVQRLDRDQTGTIDYRNLVDSRRKMVKDQRRQQRRQETKKRQERQRSQRALRSFHNAVRALTPPPAPREAPGSSHSSAPNSSSPLSSWGQDGGSRYKASSSLHLQHDVADTPEAESLYSSQDSLASDFEPVTPQRSSSPTSLQEEDLVPS